MTILTFTIILLLGAYCAGLLGSLTGLGGGVVVIPLLTLVFGVDFHYAVGGALVASIATSSGSGSAYVKEGITNIRLGMFLEIATTIGAVAGAVVAVWLNNSTIAVIYGFVLLLTAVMQQVRKQDHEGTRGSDMARRLKSTVGEVQGERDKLNTLFLHMTDGVAAFTTEGKLIHMNPATENLLGVRMEDGLSFDEMFADLDMPNSDETAMRTFLTSEITRFGRVLSVTLAPYGALDGEGGVIAVIHDITEQRRLDERKPRERRGDCGLLPDSQYPQPAL